MLKLKSIVIAGAAALTLMAMGGCDQVQKSASQVVDQARESASQALESTHEAAQQALNDTLGADREKPAPDSEQRDTQDI